MQIGIDVGYNATKAVSNGRRCAFASAVGTPDKARFSLSGNGNGIILEEPRACAIGDAAVTQSRFVNRNESRDWITSDDWAALFGAALSELTTATHAALSVVTGLPVAFYDDKDKLQGCLIGEHRVKREGRRGQTFTVDNVRVIPQPFGTLLSAVLDDAGAIADAALAQGAVGIIDVGGKTCNLLSVNQLSEIGRETASVNLGGWDLVRAVKRDLARDYPGLELRDHALADAIRARKVNYFGEPVPDFGAMIDGHAGRLAGQVIAEAGQLWNGGATLDAVLITGGGALLLGDYIRKHWRHARVVSDPVMSNALGYHRLAVRLWG